MKEIDPKITKRAIAYELWMKAPMPMVTLFKTLNVSNLIKIGKRTQLKFNMLMCWCIGKAASRTKEFYILPVGEKLIQYDELAINTVVATKDGGINTCDIPFSNNLMQFNQDYIALTTQVHDSCQTHNLEENYMVIGTSALSKHEIDGAINIYAGFYNNPFLIWGKYRKKMFKEILPISFQFHHTQMDGEEAAQFLDYLQDEIDALRL